MFPNVDGDPVQLVKGQCDFRLKFIDLSQFNNRLGLARRLVGKARNLSFDLSVGPLWQPILVRMHATKHILVLVMHHIISDAWSMEVFIEDLVAFYRAHGAGEANPLHPLSLQYKDFAIWHNGLCLSEVMMPHRDYWHQRFSGGVPQFTLTPDRTRPESLTYSGDTVTFTMHGESYRGLKQLASERKATMYSLCVAVVKTLLHRCTGADEIVIGTQTNGRQHADLSVRSVSS